MSREVKIGLLALVAILGSVWGYAFLKGQNLLSRSARYYVNFDNIDLIPISAPVLISGVQVGTVSNKSLDPKDMKTVTLELDVDNQYKIPTNTEAVLISMGLLGEKGVELKLAGPCSGNDCAKSGDYLQGRVQGMMEAVLGEGSMNDVMAGVGTGLGTAFDSINVRLSDPDNDGRISKIFKNIDELTAGLDKTRKNMDVLLYATNKNIGAMAENMNAILGTIKNNNEAIEAILKNAAGFTGQLNDSELKETIGNMNKTMVSADGALKSMDSTMKELDKTLANLQKITTELNNGEGSLGKLLTDEGLYTQLNEASSNLNLLLEDFRRTPKRYIGSFWLGKKNRPYVPYEGDESDKK